MTAMVGSAAVGAQYIAGKAARDALFLNYFEASALPNMKVGMAIFSITLVILSSRVLKRVSPGVWVPLAYGASSLLFIVEWALIATVPELATRVLYLQVSGIGPMLGSGFWLIASERFDPHTAKKRFGQIAGGGTFGGLLGGLIADRVSVNWSIGALLPLLAVFNVVCAWQIRRLAAMSPSAGRPSQVPSGSAEPPQSGLRVMAEARYLRALAVVVFLGAVAAAFVDLVFMTQVKATVGRGPALGRFFSRYNAALSLITFVIQTAGSRVVLERLGLAFAAGTPGLTFLVGGTTTLFLPGLGGILATRWSEAVLRGSIYRAGYELFFTPIPTRDKRAVKSIIDVGVDRTGDIVSNGLITLLALSGQRTALLTVGIGCSAVAVLVAYRLKRGYSETLAKSLLSRAVELDLSEVEDLTTRTTILQTLPALRSGAVDAEKEHAVATTPPAGEPAVVDPAIQEIVTLQSGDRRGIIRVLRSESGLARPLVPYVISLLARDEVAEECVRALRGVAEERVGELLDTLLDPNQPFAVRRRLARVFSVCVSQRAVDGLLLGLEDLRFEVRFQCGRSLLAIVEKNPNVRIDKDRILAVVKREVAVNKQVWENRRLLDEPEEGDRRTFLEELIRDRASQSLAHVFTMLALVLPTEPLRIAFRGLHTDDQGLRGTSLEYLESVLPSDIRALLWPFLEDRRPAGKPAPAREEALAELLRSRQSILLNLESLKRRHPGGVNVA
jgi:ATP:ADP antiporter, AAA family